MLCAAWGATASVPLSGPLPPAAPLALLSAGGSAPSVGRERGAPPFCGVRVGPPSAMDPPVIISAGEEQEEEKEEYEEWLLAELGGGGGGARPSPCAGPASAAAICRGLVELLVADGAAAPGPPPSPGVAPAGGGALPPAGGSPLSFIGSRRLPVETASRVRPPVRVRVDPAVFAAHPRVRSVLARGLRVRVPASVPGVWRQTARSPLMDAAVADFVAAGVLVPGQPRACYPLFAVSKSVKVARLVYDLSIMTPHMSRRPCHLPSIEKALQAAADGYRFAIKLDLRDGFYHIPLAPST